MKENEIEIEVVETDIIEENSEIVSQKNVTVSNLLQKNNELLEYHNNIMIENKKITNMNSMANILFKLILVAAAAVFSFFLYKIYLELVISNKKEMKIVNNLPQQETPVFNVQVPKTDVAINTQGILDKVSYYVGGYHGFVYKNTSHNIVYCRTKNSESIYDAVLSPNSSVELAVEIVSCKDAQLIEINNPHKLNENRGPAKILFKI